MSNENEKTVFNSSVSGSLICKKCGHPICPHCGDWCDTILYSKNDKGNHCEAEEEEEDYPILCCGGTCEF
jgi:hypothetical protein